MPNYVDTDYSSDYVEGDTPASEPIVTNTDIQFLKDEIATLKTMLLNITSIVSNLPTKDYIDTQIPFVDDMSVKVFPVGTQVKVAGFSGVCEVISSQYIPDSEHTYVVIYTVSYVENGITKISSFPSTHVVLYVPEGT